MPAGPLPGALKNWSLLGQGVQGAAALDADQARGAFQGQRQPRHVVVIAVGPAQGVTQPMRADLPVDPGAALRLRVPQLCVDQAVQQVGLPPVVPGAEHAVFAVRRPGDDSQLGAGQSPEPAQVALRDGGFGGGCPVRPYLIHTCRSCPTGCGGGRARCLAADQRPAAQDPPAAPGNGAERSVCSRAGTGRRTAAPRPSNRSAVGNRVVLHGD